MGEDNLTEVFDGQFHFEDGLCAPDHFCCVCAEHMDTEDLVGLRINEDLGFTRSLEAVLRNEAARHLSGDLCD